MKFILHFKHLFCFIILIKNNFPIPYLLSNIVLEIMITYIVGTFLD